MLAVEIIGYLGADAEIREYNGTRFISFRVATKERRKDSHGNDIDITNWISCTRNADGEIVKYLRKGTQVFVRGSLSVSTYTGKNGVAIDMSCRCFEIQLLGRKEEEKKQQDAEPVNDPPF